MKELNTPFALLENLVAKHWDLKPWDFRSLSRDHRAELVATYIADKKTTSYYDSERARMMDAKRKK